MSFPHFPAFAAIWLAAIALQFITVQSMPQVAYATWADDVYTLASIVIAAVLLQQLDGLGHRAGSLVVELYREHLLLSFRTGAARAPVATEGTY